ncbi:hypothetical protein IH992_06030 [Candidatus Poribacteria bacterium]|nr:hypothetical protein [Candidatus Poribacteria bacterium]
MNRTNWGLRSLILITLFGISSNGVAQVDTWTQKADMPTARWGLSTSVVDGIITTIDTLVKKMTPDLTSDITVPHFPHLLRVFMFN